MFIRGSVLLIIKPSLREDAFLERVFDIADFADHVGEFDDVGMGVAAGEDEVDEGRFLLQDFEHIFDVK